MFCKTKNKPVLEGHLDINVPSFKPYGEAIASNVFYAQRIFPPSNFPFQTFSLRTFH